MATRRLKYTIPAICTAFALAVSVLCTPFSKAGANEYRAQLTDTSLTSFPTAQTSSPTEFDSPASSNPEDAIRFVMTKFEGPGFVANDNGHGPSRYGILGEANHLSYQEVENLSADQAAEIYKKNYWDAINISSLPEPMRLVAFNAAVQFGPQRAESMIEQAGDNPQVLLDESKNFCDGLEERNPDRYRNYMKAWGSRQATLASFINNYRYMPTHAKGDTFASSHTQIASANDVSREARPRVLAASFLSAPSFAAVPANLLVWLRGLFGVALIVALYKFFRINTKRDEQKQKKAPLPSKKSLAQKNGVVPELASLSFPHNIQRTDDIPQQAVSGFYADGSDLTDREREAFYKIFWQHGPVQANNQWHVHYPPSSEVTVQKGRLDICDEDGIEDSLLYIALAWGNKCELNDGSPELRQKMARVAQRLVDNGRLASGFTIQGLGTFEVQHAHNSREAPVRNRFARSMSSMSTQLQLA